MDVDNTYSDVSSAGQISLQNMRIGCSSRTTLDFREEAGVCSSADALNEFVVMGRSHETGAERSSVRGTA